ncbi:spermatogenesis associated protein 5 [Bulinus truncatus]|nr:spermatogenesis associated protein 5 [Bulinus truncatus]
MLFFVRINSGLNICIRSNCYRCLLETERGETEKRTLILSQKMNLWDKTAGVYDKSKQSDWVQCSLCGKLFVSQDAEVHAISCDADHGYIQKKVFHGKVMNVEGILLKDGSQLIKTVRDYNSVIWLAIPTMQVCGFSIGQPCIVNKTIVKRAWPNQTQSCSTAAMSAECMKDIKVQKGDTVAIERFYWKEHVASIVELTLEERNPLFETDEFCAFVSSYLDGKYITEGTPLTIHYFGLLCHCLVSSIYEQVNREKTPAKPCTMSLDQNCSTPLKEVEHNKISSVHNQSLSSFGAEDSVSEAGDASFLSSHDISLSMSSLNISNTSLDESSLSTPQSQKFSNIVSPSQESILEDNQDSSSGLNFYLVSSSVTKFTVISKDLLEKPPGTECRFSLKDLGGLTSQIAEMKEIILKTQVTDGRSHCILLHGPQGTGKTLLVKTLTFDLGIPTFHLTGADIWSKLFGEAEANLKKLFQMAQDRSPSIVVIDDFDVLCPKRSQNTTGQQGHRIVATLCSIIDNMAMSKTLAPVVVIGISNKKDDIDPALRRAGRFDSEVEVGVPTANQRLEILQVMMNKVPHEVTADELETVARNAHGYVGADLGALVGAAVSLASRNQDPDSPLFRVSFGDLVHAGNEIKPSALREIQLDVTQVLWSDIGGMSEVKMRLLEAVVWPMTNPGGFKRMGISAPKGLLMYGPPGCSKTMVAKALATECKFNFLAVKGPELFNQYVGESEKAVREIFHKAKSAAPSIIFFDEIDAIAARRGSSSGGSGVDDRVLTQLLTEMDGMEFLKDVFIMAATNRPDKIDQALLRPGRFDSLIYVPLPDDATRKEILEKKLSNMCISEDVHIDWLVEQTIDYSGAEIIQVCQEAGLCALREDLRIQHAGKKHFELALNKVQPQTAPELIQIYQKFSNSRIK